MDALTDILPNIYSGFKVIYILHQNIQLQVNVTFCALLKITAGKTK